MCHPRAGDTPFIKLIDVGRQLIANRIQGYLNSKIMFFLANHHITPRPSESARLLLPAASSGP